MEPTNSAIKYECSQIKHGHLWVIPTNKEVISEMNLHNEFINYTYPFLHTNIHNIGILFQYPINTM